MQELRVFQNQDFGEVRTITEGDKVLFCGSDVAKALGYVKPNNAINQHCKCATLKQGIIVDSLGRSQAALFIPEGDIYRLIVKSNLPSAEKFERWVFDEVLPSIRAKGTYSRPMTQTEIILAQAQALVEIERIATQAEQTAQATADKLSTAIDIFASPITESWKDETNRKINSICKNQGLSYSAFKGDLYAELERSASCDLTARQRNLKARMKKAGATYKEQQAITKIDVIARDEHLKLIFDGIVRKYCAKYAS